MTLLCRPHCVEAFTFVGLGGAAIVIAVIACVWAVFVLIGAGLDWLVDNFGNKRRP